MEATIVCRGYFGIMEEINGGYCSSWVGFWDI